MPIKSWSVLINDAEDSFEPVPAGDYDLKIIKSEASLSKSGKSMWKICTEVLEGPYAKRKIWGQLTLSPESPTALGIFFRQMKALGLTQDYFAQDPTDSHVANALVGRTFRGQIGVRTWQGQERNEINNYTALSSAPNAAPSAPVTPQPTQGSGSAPAAAVAPAPTTPPPAAAAAAPQQASTQQQAAPAPIGQPEPPAAPTQDIPQAAASEAPPQLPDGDPF